MQGPRLGRHQCCIVSATYQSGDREPRKFRLCGGAAARASRRGSAALLLRLAVPRACTQKNAVRGLAAACMPGWLASDSGSPQCHGGSCLAAAAAAAGSTATASCWCSCMRRHAVIRIHHCLSQLCVLHANQHKKNFQTLMPVRPCPPPRADGGILPDGSPGAAVPSHAVGRHPRH